MGKLFSSENKTIQSWSHFVDDWSSLVGGSYGASDLEALVIDLDGEAEIIQQDDRVTVVDVMGPDAMMVLGCNSMWCFSLPKGEGYWGQYSYNGHVYFIFVDDDEQYVLTFPSENSLYDITNNPVDEDESYNHMVKMGVDISKLTFGGSDDAMKLIKKYTKVKKRKRELEPVSEIRKAVRKIIEEMFKN